MCRLQTYLAAFFGDFAAFLAFLGDLAFLAAGFLAAGFLAALLAGAFDRFGAAAFLAFFLAGAFFFEIFFLEAVLAEAFFLLAFLAPEALGFFLREAFFLAALAFFLAAASFFLAASLAFLAAADTLIAIFLAASFSFFLAAEAFALALALAAETFFLALADSSGEIFKDPERPFVEDDSCPLSSIFLRARFKVAGFFGWSSVVIFLKESPFLPCWASSKPKTWVAWEAGALAALGAPLAILFLGEAAAFLAEALAAAGFLAAGFLAMAGAEAGIGMSLTGGCWSDIFSLEN